MRWAVLILAILEIFLTGRGSPAAADHTSSCTVASVVDGDTFDCTDGTRVRLLQINTPELSECGGQWAKAALENIFLTPGRQVRLDYDGVTEDRYGRHLAAPIVIGTDGNEYNISIVMAYVGLARAAYYGDNDKYLDWANASEGWARAAQWNMWAPGGPFNGGINCGDAILPPSTHPPTPTPGDGCAPSYPDVCIPQPPPDLDCPQISHRNFRVVGSDPHRFDGDHDGVGCES
jgi:micrococcal nuclease